MTTAIQQDVENKEAEVIVGNVERNNMIAEIAERSRKERDAELGIVEEPKQEELKEIVEEIQPEEKHEEPKIETVKVKIDGEEREVPKEKILDAGIRTLQKESSADKRLEEATRLLREVQERIVQPKQEENPSQQWDDATIAYALEHGTEEQKAQAIGLLRGRDMATPEQIAAIAERNVLDRVDFLESSKWFVSEYGDIANDPYLFQLASMAEDKARASGDTRPRKELYKSIGDDLRKWKGGITTTLEEKKEKKSTIVNLPSASMKKSSTEAEIKPKSTSDVIEEMRKRRGQM